MMLRGLTCGSGCLLILEHGQSAPSWCMQGTSTGHTYHLMIRLRHVHRVVCEALLGELCEAPLGELGFPNDCAAVWRFGNWGCSKKSMENE